MAQPTADGQRGGTGHGASHLGVLVGKPQAPNNLNPLVAPHLISGGAALSPTVALGLPGMYQIHVDKRGMDKVHSKLLQAVHQGIKRCNQCRAATFSAGSLRARERRGLLGSAETQTPAGSDNDRKEGQMPVPQACKARRLRR